MEQYAWIVWLAAIVISVIAEGATLALVSVWFIPGAAVALILSLCHVPVVIQIIAFAVISIGSLTFMRPVFKKFLKIKTTPTNADSLVGEKGVVIENVNNISATGAVKIRGQVWTARSTSNDVTLNEGDIVTVSSIEGVKLVCTK